MHDQHAGHEWHAAQAQGHYLKLAAMVGLSFIAMYVLMYAMVDRIGNVYNHLNQAYMAGLMAAPMLVIELLLMRHMYPDRKRNGVLVAVGVLAGIVFWLLIREQAAISERQFYRSMIPHHAGAILMCEQRKTDSPEVARLCDGILRSQRAEIAQMKSLLGESPSGE